MSLLALVSLVPADGSPATPVVARTGNVGDTGPRFRSFARDGRRFVLFIGGEGKNGIHLASLDSEERQLVVDDVLSAPLLAPTPDG